MLESSDLRTLMPPLWSPPFPFSQTLMTQARQIEMTHICYGKTEPAWTRHLHLHSPQGLQATYRIVHPWPYVQRNVVGSPWGRVRWRRASALTYGQFDESMIHRQRSNKSNQTLIDLKPILARALFVRTPPSSSSHFERTPLLELISRPEALEGEWATNAL